jgi:oligopeptide transport system substrate-binding protein
MAGRRPVLVSLLVIVLAACSVAPGTSPPPAPSGPVDARIGGAAPVSWDPALAGDVGSAATLGQVFEGLTAFDADSNVQPALAQSWAVENGGRRIVFQLRDGLKFSDGSPLTGDDVVFSWLRLLNPQRRSPLASLLDDVTGAAAYGRGEIPPGQVGISAERNRVTVELRRPASYFVSVTAAPPLAVVSRNEPPADSEQLPGNLVVSGAYRPFAQNESSIRLEGNANYWAGPPALRIVRLITNIEGKSAATAFEDGDIDYTGVSAFDASWLRYDRGLGPQLREIQTMGLLYYGFDTSRAPFNDRRVRQAFAQAVDWHRLVTLGDAQAVPATSLVPPGIPGRSTTDFSPRHDPAAAKAALAAAGYPGGRGFPTVTLVSSGGSYESGVIHELKQVLGVTVGLEIMSFNGFFERLDEEPPQFWNLSWIADYPSPHDFLGLLAESGSGNNYARWSNRAYDAALEAAAATADVAQQQRHYDTAQRILRDEAALIPVSYSQGWALSSPRLLGANQSGVGFLRLAGLKWSDR